MTETVVITGASAGIGRAAAELFGRRGANVALIARGEDGLRAAAQFSWVLSRLPRRPQPVPPIYQPEVAAQGIVFAAGHPDRKEHWVGASTVGTIMAQKFAAPVLDRYLARTGYDSQQTKDQADPRQPANLWQPVDQQPGTDHGAHGSFDGKSRPRSGQLDVTERAQEAGSAIGRALGTPCTPGNARTPASETAVPNLRHLEYFHDHARIESMLFEGALDPGGGTLRPDPARPGLGLALKESDAAPFRVA